MSDLALSIIIVNWNSKEYLDLCLKSILESGTTFSYEIIVVDNASFDGSYNLIQEKYPNTKYIQAEVNGGFAYANNLGFEASRGNQLLFLNPDTEIDSQALNKMHHALSTYPGAGGAGSTLLNSDGTLQASCIQSFPTITNQAFDSEFLRNFRWTSSFWGNAPLFQKEDELFEVEAVSGACLMVSRDAFLKIGRFSSDYFMYAEDRDLCYKLRSVGYKMVFVKNAKVTHHGGGSTSDNSGNRFTNVMIKDSIYRFLKKHRGKFYAFSYRLIMFLTAAMRIVFLIIISPYLYAIKRLFPKSSLYKWFHILMWSIGGEGWRHKYVVPSRDNKL